MWLIRASIRNPYMVAALVFMILVLGILAVVRIPVDILPVFKAPAVQVLTYFQGMPASTVEKTITNRVERWTGQAPSIERIESKSVPGVSVVKLYFRDDIDPNEALTITTSLAQGTLPTLPPNTLPPVSLRFDPTGTIPLGVLTVSNPRMNEANVKDLARIQVRNMLGGVPGVVAPVVIGGKDRTVLVYLDPKRMQVRNVSPLDVVKALRQQNQMVTPGIAYFGKDQILLDTNFMVDKVRELNEIPIRTRPGDRVYLKDVGFAKDSSAIQTSRVRITDKESPEGRKEVYVPIYRQQGASSLAVAEGVRKHLKFMEDRLPPGTHLHFVMDQSFYVKESINSLVHEGIIGSALVSVMILIFLGNWRMTLIASLSIPLSVLGSVIGLSALGLTINAMTLGGLALAIGPLVDDAIVALENIHRNYHLGKSRVRAALDGSLQVMVPVLVATCTTIIVLAPLALMPGMGGFLFKPLALAVAFAMIASFVLSRTFVPMMCAKFLPEEHGRVPAGCTAPATSHLQLHDRPRGFFGRLHARFDRALDGVTRRYERLLGFALRHRFAVLTTVAVLFAGSLCLTFGIGREFFPQVDAGQITIFVRAPSKSRLDATEEHVIDVERFLKEQIPESEREMIVSEIGLNPDWSAAYSPNSGQQDAVIRVQLNENRRLSAQKYAKRLRHALAKDPNRFGDLRFAFDTGGMVSTALNYGASSPLDVQLEGGTSARENLRLAQEVRRRIEGIRGAADVRVQQRMDAQYLLLEVNRKKAADYGLSAEDVLLQVVAAMNSSVSINRNFWVDNETGNQYFVAVQYPEDQNMNLDDVLNINATGTNQVEGVKLSQLVTRRSRQGGVEINHVGMQRTFDVLINTEDRDIAGLARDVEKVLDDLQHEHWKAADPKDQTERPTQPGSRGEEWVFPGRARLHLMGEYARMNDSFVKLAGGLALAALLVYLLQVALFRSWVGPFIIMFTVPLGLIGVLTMLFLTRTTLNVQSEMGVIFLVGIAVNNGVLLVEFANEQRRQGATVPKAIATAAAIRFRPIIMTFLATFIALTPMAIGLGKGSEANVPLARAVVGGLLTSTCLTLFVVPILYTLLIREGTGQNEALEAELADNPVERASVLAAAPLPETVLSQPAGMALIKSDGHSIPHAEASQDGNKPV
jgi:multidrug efflux pump subunit AcrB